MFVYILDLASGRFSIGCIIRYYLQDVTWFNGLDNTMQKLRNLSHVFSSPERSSAYINMAWYLGNSRQKY